MIRIAALLRLIMSKPLLVYNACIGSAILAILARVAVKTGNVGVIPSLML